jgi:uncharacterized protein
MKSREILAQTAHRPYPHPDGQWIMRQHWCDLLFAHWSVDPDALRRRIPRELELDLDDLGRAWLAVVPFRMENIRFSFTPAAPWISAFPELNVRTYVKYKGQPGVYFFSLDAANSVGCALGRAWFFLPYEHARMRLNQGGDPVRYTSFRRGRARAAGRAEGAADFIAEYAPAGPVYYSAPGTLEHWLTERYRLFSYNGKTSRVWGGEIQHGPWPLQPARARISVNTMARPVGFGLSPEPELLHFVRNIEVLCWRPAPA